MKKNYYSDIMKSCRNCGFKNLIWNVYCLDGVIFTLKISLNTLLFCALIIKISKNEIYFQYPLKYIKKSSLKYFELIIVINT